MDFNIDLTEFPSAVHSGIYCLVRGFVPLERSLTGIEDADLRASCVDLHGFLTAMYSDMYDNAEAWHLPVQALEKFRGEKIDSTTRKNTKKYSNILSLTYNAAPRYLLTLLKLAIYGEMRGDTLFISDEHMMLINKQVSTSVSPITLNKRLSALERVGLVHIDSGFISTLYPKMFPALHALAKRSSGSICCDFVATTADFRYLMPHHKPKPEDFINPLVTVQRERAEELHRFALENGVKASISKFMSVSYNYKNKKVMYIDTWNEGYSRLLIVRLSFAHPEEGEATISERLEQETPEFRKKALHNLWRCVMCCNKHLGSFTTVQGKRQRVCDKVLGFFYKDPNDENIETIKRLIEIRCEMIDAAKRK